VTYFTIIFLVCSPEPACQAQLILSKLDQFWLNQLRCSASPFLPSAAEDNLCLLLCAPQSFPSLSDLVPLLNHPSSNDNEAVNLISMVAKKHNTTTLRSIFQVHLKFTSNSSTEPIIGRDPRQVPGFYCLGRSSVINLGSNSLAQTVSVDF
jgi:hypothetical protein